MSQLYFTKTACLLDSLQHQGQHSSIAPRILAYSCLLSDFIVNSWKMINKRGNDFLLELIFFLFVYFIFSELEHERVVREELFDDILLIDE